MTLEQFITGRTITHIRYHLPGLGWREVDDSLGDLTEFIKRTFSQWQDSYGKVCNDMCDTKWVWDRMHDNALRCEGGFPTSLTVTGEKRC